MPHQHDSAQRPRPFVPPVRPFRGPATVARPESAPLTPPNGARSAAPFVARRPVKVEEEGKAPAQGEASPTTIGAVVAPEPATVVPASHPLAELAPVNRPASAGDDAHLYGHDPFSAAVSTRVATPVSRPVEPSVRDGAAPEEAATALAGLPFFDDHGGEHEAAKKPDRVHTSGRLHRVEFDPAAVLGSIADRIRSGALHVPDLDPRASEEATLAAILAALLRDSRR